MPVLNTPAHVKFALYKDPEAQKFYSIICKIGYCTLITH